MRRRASLLLLGALSLRAALAWGITGHHVVAMIADARLSPEVHDRINRLLYNGRYTLRDLSVCPDEMRTPKPDQACIDTGAGAITPRTAPWHYIDIPVPVSNKDLEAYCPHGDCVVDKIEQFENVLHDSNNDVDRRRALMFLVHFLGDIHQPLHTTDRACDQGGNREFVNFYLGDKELANQHLHWAWDGDMVDKLMMDHRLKDEQALASYLLDRLDTDAVAKWSAATVPEITWESYGIAVKKVYHDIPFQDFCGVPRDAPPPAATNLAHGYENAGSRIVREQLTKAGVRLAAALERAMTH